MISSAVVALLIGACADRSPWFLLPLLMIYAVTVLGCVDVRHGDGRKSRLPRGHDGNAFDCRV